MGVPAFWASPFPKRGDDGHITLTPGSKLVPRTFAVKIKALQTRSVAPPPPDPPKKAQEKTTTTF